MVSYIPNILTLARIAMVPWLLVLLERQEYGSSLIVFIIAGISDAADGYIAKKYNASSRLGAILDPLADKALAVSAYIMLSLLQHIPYWLMIVVVFRDVVIVAGFLIMQMVFEKVEMNPLKISKLNTFVQITFITLVLVALAAGLDFSSYMDIASYIVLFTSVLSGGAYVWIWSVKAMQSE